ncbi:unnamed protein product [Brassicogethes aeneus]|uniref:Uncharacterized protein n=1 Tax=Brassicogethes aeneus TaxID=1431903 RepID=A0A9P0B933_BRAAE|nr:unnamed protein product [Brassicogethes aeneus]
MDFTEDQIREAKDFGEFYIDLVENYKTTVKYYLSDDIVLDWFGQTVKGEKKVNLFIKSNVATVKHFFSDAKPVENIGFRDTHVVKLPREPKKPIPSLLSPPRNEYHLRTPTKQTLPSTSSTPNKSSTRIRSDSVHSPAKRFKPTKLEFDSESESIEPECESLTVKFMLCEGSVEFHRPSIKKLQTETKWKRPCKLSIGYTLRNKQDYTIHLIIYEGNVKCRRNLLKDFSAEAEN